MEGRRRIFCQILFLSTLSLGTCNSKASFQKFKGEATSPYFTSQSKTYVGQVGSRQTLLCEVQNLGSSTLIWKKDGRIISAGETVIRKDTRLNLIGYNLDIDDIIEEDAGEYICEIETYGAPLHQTHRLEVLVPPRVQPKPEDGKFVVRRGSTITLECSATGNPTPTITWTRANNMLPSGEKSLSGISIVIQEVTRHHTGIYICTADNGVGQASSGEIDLQVLYPPEIEVDQTWIKKKDGIEAEVSCHVHAEPKADVRWYKETMLLDSNDNRLMQTYGNKHVLLLRNVKETDFGNYSCLADNSLGKERKAIEVSGRPHAAKVISPSIGFSKDTYNLTWIVDSFIKIEEYRILYRVHTKNELDRFPPPKHSEWTNIIPTMLGKDSSFGFKNSFTFTASFTFFGLAPSTDYEVIIQSRNKAGWSDASKIFKFSTRAEDFDPRGLQLQEADQAGYFSGASTFSHSFLLAFLLLLISFN